jgi:hypothetical protein
MEVRGFRELQASFRDAPRKIQNLGRQWAKDVAADEVKYVRKAAPGKTGKFRRTIQPYSRAFVIGVKFEPYDKLGLKLKKWIIEGTPPHIIRAKYAKVLRFFWGRRHHWYMFKSVHHPGTKPNDFVKRGADKFQPRVQYWLRELESRIVKAMGAK